MGREMEAKGHAAFFDVSPAALGLRRGLAGNHLAGDQVFQAGEISGQ